MQQITGIIHPDSIFGNSISLVIANDIESCAVQFRKNLKSLAAAFKIGDTVTVGYTRRFSKAKSGTLHNNLIALSIEIYNIEVKEPEYLT